MRSRVHRYRRLADSALSRRHTDDPGGGVGREEKRHRRGVAVTVAGVIVAGLVVLVGVRVDAQHAGAQALAQPGALGVAHHDEVKLHFFDARHSEGDAVDFVGQGVGARPGGDRQRDLEQGPTPLRSHRAHEAELAQSEVELRIDDRA